MSVNMEAKEENITFTCSDGAEMDAYICRPSQAQSIPQPAIIVVHEAFGLNNQIRGVAKRFAGQGFVAIAPNLFTRNADVMNEKNIESAMRPLWSIPPEKRNDPSSIQELMKSMTETQRNVIKIFFMGRETMEKQMVKDLLDCASFLQHQTYVNGNKLGITGFCLGGGLTYQLSTVYPFSASVPFYGANPKPLDSVEKIKGPVLAFYAGEDEGINAGVADLVKSMIKYKKDFQMKLYAGAQHSFFNETRPSYNERVAKDAWNSAVDFFNLHLRT